jgi:hypothetical protein
MKLIYKPWMAPVTHQEIIEAMNGFIRLAGMVGAACLGLVSPCCLLARTKPNRDIMEENQI